MAEPTPQQLQRARRAGWTSDEEPPDGWDAHGEFQEGVIPAVFDSLESAMAAQVRDED